MPSLHRPLAPWVSSAMLDRPLGPSHLPSDAGVYWCAVRPQAVLATLAGRASPRRSVVHRHAEPIDRQPVRHAASCATSVLDPGASAPPHHLSLVAARGEIFPTAARSKLLLFAAIAALLTSLPPSATVRPAAPAVLTAPVPEVVAPAASDPIVQRRARRSAAPSNSARYRLTPSTSRGGTRR